MSLNCREMETVLACYTDAGGVPQTIVAHYEYGTNDVGNTIIVATRYTSIDGAPIDTSAGTVVAGACTAIPADIEWQCMRDVQPDGTTVEFFRRVTTVYDAAGTPTNTITDFEKDYVTEYTVTGTEVPCDQDCEPSTAQGVLTTWG